ncbi:hypothetical protein AOLI_G00316320 [Acnodon oligacanthus]
MEDQDFKFFLQLFHHIMPHVDLLYAKLQKKVIGSVYIQDSIQQDIQKIRNSVHSMVGQSSVGGGQPVKRRRTLGVEDHERMAAEVCDIILGHSRGRFSFTDHLILITTPMTTAEAERCFSTLKRMKTFLRNSVTQDRLNALALLSVERRPVTEMTDFNRRGIEKFAGQKERRANSTSRHWTSGGASEEENSSGTSMVVDRVVVRCSPPWLQVEIQLKS